MKKLAVICTAESMKHPRWRDWIEFIRLKDKYVIGNAIGYYYGFDFSTDRELISNHLMENHTLVSIEEALSEMDNHMKPKAFAVKCTDDIRHTPEWKEWISHINMKYNRALAGNDLGSYYGVDIIHNEVIYRSSIEYCTEIKLVSLSEALELVSNIKPPKKVRTPRAFSNITGLADVVLELDSGAKLYTNGDITIPIDIASKWEAVDDDFKVGDHVVLVSNESGSAHGIGSLGVIIEIHEDGDYLIDVNGWVDRNGTWSEHSDLRLATTSEISEYNKLPDIAGYSGKFEGTRVIYGCTSVEVDALPEFKGRQLEYIALEGDIKVTQKQIQKIKYLYSKWKK